jgi:hypothetical protein
MTRWTDMQNISSQLKTPTKSESLNLDGGDNIGKIS